jgi:hypothetical protein
VFLALRKMGKTRNGFSRNTSLRFERPGEAIFCVLTEAGINTLQGVRKWELKKIEHEEDGVTQKGLFNLHRLLIISAAPRALERNLFAAR